MRFDELGLDPDILRSLEAMNFHEMTPVQEATIPIILNDSDLIGCAQVKPLHTPYPFWTSSFANPIPTMWSGH